MSDHDTLMALVDALIESFDGGAPTMQARAALLEKLSEIEREHNALLAQHTRLREFSLPYLKQALDRNEMLILAVKKAPPQSHLFGANYVGTLETECNELLAVIDEIRAAAQQTQGE